MEFFWNGDLLAQAAINLYGSLTVLWVLSLLLKDASIIDIFWGTGFIIIAWSVFAGVESPGPLGFTLCVMTTMWGLRLTFYLAFRNIGHGEDYRYQNFRRNGGKWWPLKSLYAVFGLQGTLALIISLPLSMSIAQPGHAMTSLGYLGAGLFSVGLVFETLGDFQLTRFKANPDNKGKVLDSGLWRYTRHPNYFGDSLVWWGLYLVAIGAPGVTWTIIGPLLMTFLLMKVSGVAMLEVKLKKTRPQYKDYIESTNAFFPWFPKPVRKSEGADSALPSR